MAPTRNVPPAAGAMLESLRGLGYTTATAIADLVDNSVSADAGQVDVLFEWNGSDSWIRIGDNGRGMSDAELEAAMRLGARDPRAQRRADDLGRFGMGLKTASFSQGRILTVATTKADHERSCLRWDLDQLGGAEGSWLLHEGARSGSESRIAAGLTGETGTVVLWENLDRVVTDGFTAQDMIDLIEQVESHLAMTFHRLIDDGLKLRINGRPVQSWDPFLTGHPGKAMESVEYRLQNAAGVMAQCHVLPHRDLLKPAEYEAAAGPVGWPAQEGFYIYRNRRLLLAGGWLGLGDRGRRWTRDEAHRLARIRLDIPNTADAEWKINILKSTASVPVRLRTQLTRLASETRDVAKRVFAHRGRLTTGRAEASGGIPDVWAVHHSTKGNSYHISKQHDLVASILDRAGPLRSDIISLLSLIAETVPVQKIWLDTAEQTNVSRGGFAAAPDEIETTLNSLFEALVEFRGLSPDEARLRLSRTPPFDQHPDIVQRIGGNSE
ncbi:ATP-binding protein [Sphingomonas sp. Marseille-Q8236]